MNVARRMLAALLVGCLAAGYAPGQEAPTTQPGDAPVPASAPLPLIDPQPADAPPPALATTPPADAWTPTPAQILAQLAASYRGGPLAERVRLRVVGEAGRERTSRVELRLDAGDEGRPRRMRVDLGRYTLYAEGEEVHVLDRYNPGAYAALANPAGPGLGVGALPLLPLPQIAWAFDAEAIEPTRMLAPLVDAVAWRQADVDAASGQTWLRGDVSPGSANLLIGGETPRLISARVALAHGLASVRLEVEAIPEGDPAKWAPDVIGRRRVASLAELRPPQPDIDVGERLPSLGLMTSDLRLWTLREELAASVNGRAPAIGALVLYRAGQGEADAQAGWLALHEARLQHERRAAVERRPLPRILARPVGVLELDEVTPERVRELGAIWVSRQVDPGWTSTGRAMLDRFATGSHAIVILVNREERLGAVVRLDGRAGEPEGLIQDLSDAFEAVARASSIEITPEVLPAAEPR
ncbi:MAG: hypothetical protein HUU18_00885 [Phycisphaerales bacterium]|nr:hypothetical protein [Phycisphaerales bacterium]